MHAKDDITDGSTNHSRYGLIKYYITEGAVQTARHLRASILTKCRTLCQVFLLLGNAISVHSTQIFGEKFVSPT